MTIWRSCGGERKSGAVRCSIGDDVSVGDYTWTTAEPPFTQMDMIRMYGQELVGCESVKNQVLSGHIRGEKNEYGVYENIISHYKPGSSPSYNYTGRDFCVRNVTNWAGDQGFITRVNWRMVNDYEPELQANPFPEGFYRESYLLKVPGAQRKGRVHQYPRHGAGLCHHKGLCL